ncbi:phosphatase PAP2 family protein [Flaviaesturariibacter aridisoli]|uniref:Phosphatase PAP2 family protein n=1 Tax=Flaviaesturariibacter aridisoli TaxID=2545761 RepID=A0A4R4E1G6_9BACT|nr:phosphatase PAP2 family protein [Flaviaesturariibacter aridisoli]TCZ72198.1 phosphatase PAP2 family protein [Flaviaesturariibacter aridisoli]
MNALLNLDKSLFRLLNGRWHNSLFDAVLPFVRNSVTWLPLYVFLLLFIMANFRRSGWIVLYTACTAALTDTFSSTIIKNLVYRQRPCSAPDMIGQVRFIVNYCPISSSFTSSHAANHFGIATFLYFILRPVIGRWAAAGFVWAGVIAYAQIYVGVHYPIDVSAGALLGIGTGWGLYRLFVRHTGPADRESLLRVPSGAQSSR